MLKSETNRRKEELRIVWILMENMGLFIILLANIVLILLETSVRLKIWTWLSRRRFRLALRKKGLPSDLIELLMREYEDTIRRVDALNTILKSLGGVARYAGKLRNNR